MRVLSFWSPEYKEEFCSIDKEQYLKAHYVRIINAHTGYTVMQIRQKLSSKLSGLQFLKSEDLSWGGSGGTCLAHFY